MVKGGTTRIMPKPAAQLNKMGVKQSLVHKEMHTRAYQGAIMQELDRMKKQLIIYEAATQTVTEQLRNTHMSCACGVCRKEFENAFEKEACIKSMTNRLDTLKTRKRFVLGVSTPEEIKSSKQRLRLGFILYIRQVKAAVLTKKQCPACKKHFDNANLGEFLSRLDHLSSAIKTRTISP